MHSLPLFHRLAGQPVIVLGGEGIWGEAAEAKRRLVERAGGVVTSDVDAPARLAFVALAEPEAAVARLRARGVLVNAVDRPDLCDFTVPSLLERGPVLVAVGTGGVSAGLAKALRLRLEGLLPQSLGRLAEMLLGARAGLRERFPDAGERRRALDQALSAGGPLDPLDDTSAEMVYFWLAGAIGLPSRSVEFVAPADPDDLSLRRARWLGSADQVAYEPGVEPAVLDRARADAIRIALAPGEMPPGHPGLAVTLRRG